MNLDFSFLTLKVINNIILTGLIFSIKLTLIAMVLGIILGTFLAMMRLSGFKILSSFALAYVTHYSLHSIGHGYTLGFFINSFIHW